MNARSDAVIRGDRGRGALDSPKQRARLRRGGISAEQFEEAAQAAKTGCPVSQALSVPITLEVHFSE